MILIKKAFMKIWKVTPKEKYVLVNASSSEKVEDGYKNSNWNLRLVGKAKDIELHEGDRIEIISAKIENVFDKKNNKNWLSIIVFDFINQTDCKSGNVKIEDDDDFIF